MPARFGGTLVEGAHLMVLWAFAVVQPVLDVIPVDAEFFIDREVGGWSLVVAIILFAFLPPAVLLGLEVIAGLVSASFRRALHLLFVWLLAATIVLYPLTLRAAPRGWQLVIASLVVGAIAALAYTRLGWLRSLVTYLSPAPLLFLALFFFFTPAGDAVAPGAPKVVNAPPSKTPVALVFFDEFPLSSILGRDGQIDPVRYPNFARLARDGTWYRNTISSGDSTLSAIPALMTGITPDPNLTATFPDHRNNLFTLFGKSHRLDVSESETRVCPAELCARRKSQLARATLLPAALSAAFAKIVLPRNLGFTAPAPPLTWSEFSRARNSASRVDGPNGAQGELSHHPDVQFDTWLRTIKRPPRGQRRAPFFFAHFLTPHAQWKYLPSGKLYTGSFVDRAARFGGPGSWVSDPRLVYDHWLARHLIQAQFADRLLGGLMRGLKQQGLYGRSLIAVVADHGGHVAPGNSHRVVAQVSAADIGSVPFLFKRPGQTRGAIDDRFLQTVDFLPTVAHELGVKIPWRVEGRPASTLGKRGRSHVKILQGTTGRELPLSESLILRQRKRTVRHQVALFGSGNGGPGLFGAGPRPDLLGRRLADLRGARPGGPRLSIDLAGDYAKVDPRSPYLPALVTGRLEGAGAGKVHAVAIAVNGRVQATASINSYGGRRLAAMLPPQSLRPGRNRLRVFALSGSGTATRLQPIGGTP